MKKLPKFISNMKFQNKLFLGFSMLFLVILLSGGIIILSNIRYTVIQNAEKEMKKINSLFIEMTKSLVKSNIKNHLKIIAEKNKKYLQDVYVLYKNGIISKNEAIRRARKYFLSQSIGKSGYIYCLNSNGYVALHPNRGVQDTNVLAFKFVKQQVKLKEGYIEYDWKNPGEKIERKKALYMTYFKPWDWIISVSTYRDEFVSLINIKDISLALKTITYGKSGYFYIINSKGDTIFHPVLTGKNIFQLKGTESIRAMIKKKKGVSFYSWKNPREKVAKDKIAVYDYIPIFDWIIASSAYIDEIYSYYHRLRTIFIIAIILAVFVILGASRWLSIRFTLPINELTQFFETNRSDELNSRIEIKSNDEIGILSHYINRFLDSLKGYQDQLQVEILERKNIEQEIRQSEQNLQTIFNKAYNAYFIHNLDGTILDVNDQMLEMYGVTKEDAKNYSISEDYTDMMNAEEILKDRWLRVMNNEPQHFEWMGRQPKTGISFPVQVHLDKIYYNKKLAVLATVTNLTLQKRIEEQLRQSQKMEIVGNLAGGLAHDFNNVLAGIVGSLSIIQQKFQIEGHIPPEKLMKYVDIMMDSGNKAANMVKQLLTLSRKQKIELSFIDLNDLVEHIIQIGKNTFHKQVELVAKKYPHKAIVKVDATQMEQVLLNFCINADHAMTIMNADDVTWGGTLSISIDKLDSGPSLRLQFPEAQNNQYYVLSVEDTGVGISEENLTRIFNPFFSTKDKSVGTGLGLSMVYNIVRQHEGFIDVKSKEKKGTIFRIYLPVAEGDYSDESHKGMNEEMKSEGTVLIIDDEEVIHRMAGDILEDCGLTVIHATSGKNGIEIYKERGSEIDVVMLDMSMPEMSGKETYIVLKELNKSIKVLLTSGFRQDERVEKVLQLGVNDFLQKPFAYYELFNAINDLLKE